MILLQLLLLLAIQGAVGQQSTGTIKISLTVPEKVAEVQTPNGPVLESVNGESNFETELIETLTDGTKVYLYEPI